MYSGFWTSAANGGVLSRGRDRSTKRRRILAEGQQRDAARIVDVLVQHAAQPGAGERVDERPLSRNSRRTRAAA